MNNTKKQVIFTALFFLLFSLAAFNTQTYAGCGGGGGPPPPPPTTTAGCGGGGGPPPPPTTLPPSGMTTPTKTTPQTSPPTPGFGVAWEAGTTHVTMRTIMPVVDAIKPRQLYWGSSGAFTTELSVTYPSIGADSAHGWIPAFYGTNWGTVSIPVHKGDLVEVTAMGNINGSAVGTLTVTAGSCDTLFCQQINTSQNGVSGVWKEYVLKGLFKATADTTLVFAQFFWLSDYPTGTTITLKNWSTFAEIIADQTQSGTVP